MKSAIKVLGIIFFVAIIGIATTACSRANPFLGTWTVEGDDGDEIFRLELLFTGDTVRGTYTFGWFDHRFRFIEETEIVQGTYTFSRNTATITFEELGIVTAHIYGDTLIVRENGEDLWTLRR